MKKMNIAFLGVLLALHLSSQVVRAQDATTTTTETATTDMNMTTYSSTMPGNYTNMTTVSTDNGSGSTVSCTLLLPLALAASLLHDWS